MRVKVRTE